MPTLLPTSEVLIGAVERWCAAFEAGDGFSAPEPQQREVEALLVRVVTVFLECAMPRHRGKRPLGVSSPAYEVARTSSDAVRSLEKSAELWSKLDRLVTYGWSEGRQYAPRLLECREAEERARLRHDPCCVLFTHIGLAVASAERAEKKRRNPYKGFPEPEGDESPFDFSDKGYRSEPYRRRIDDSELYVALRNVDDVYAAVKHDEQLKECLGLLLLRETAKYTELRHLASGHRDLPVLRVPGLTLGAWLDALDARDDVHAIDRELDRRYREGADDALVRVDGVPTTQVIALIRELSPDAAGSPPWQNADALDQAVSRARKEIRAGIKRFADLGGDGGAGA